MTDTQRGDQYRVLSSACNFNPDTHVAVRRMTRHEWISHLSDELPGLSKSAKKNWLDALLYIDVIKEGE